MTASPAPRRRRIGLRVRRAAERGLKPARLHGGARRPPGAGRRQLLPRRGRCVPGRERHRRSHRRRAGLRESDHVQRRGRPRAAATASRRPRRPTATWSGLTWTRSSGWSAPATSERSKVGLEYACACGLCLRTSLSVLSVPHRSARPARLPTRPVLAIRSRMTPPHGISSSCSGSSSNRESRRDGEHR